MNILDFKCDEAIISFSVIVCMLKLMMVSYELSWIKSQTG